VVAVPPAEPVLRRAVTADAAAVADVWLRSFAAALPSVRSVHTDEQVCDWIREVVIGVHETWVICLGDAVAGMMALDGTDIDQLYLDPSHRGQGLGDLLIAQAKRRRPQGLGLWTFQVNTAARRFYERHGFRETVRSDGSHNEEREPDIRMEWRPMLPG
jgi:GNAT superfamily N-acetyltransferase